MKGAAHKLTQLEGQCVFGALQGAQQSFLRQLATRYPFTFQELRQLVEAARDLEQWQEQQLPAVWQRFEAELPEDLPAVQRREQLLLKVRQWMESLRVMPTRYPDAGLAAPKRGKLELVQEESSREVFGDCPVFSEKTVCCGLKTVDAVQNCGFGCSYCTIQTFYGEQVKFDAGLVDKLKNLSLEPDRFYHIGSGQSSDSLMWGNKYGLLDALCEFAERQPGVLLELKTKSANVNYLCSQPIPPNVVCSWSLNTDAIITNEEHFTAPLQQRLRAARRAADAGVAVAFHFHPMVYHDNWQEDYAAIAEIVQQQFSPEEVLFISFGSVTFIKPVVRQIRARSAATKMLQMEMVPDPHGKLTYPDDIKVKMFSAIYQAFAAWHEQVYMYLCMERAEIWHKAFGWCYGSNQEFLEDFGKHTMRKTNKEATE